MIAQKILQMLILRAMIKNKIITMRYLLIFFLLSPFYINAQVGLEYFLGDLSEHNKLIPTPESVIGHQVGEFHISHDKLSHYIQEISKTSNRVKLIDRGQSYENRTCLLYTSPSPRD